MVGGAGLLRRDQKGCWGRRRLRNAGLKCFNFHLMLYPILQQIWNYSAATGRLRSSSKIYCNINWNKLFILEVLRTLTLPLLTDSLQLQSVVMIKSMW